MDEVKKALQALTVAIENSDAVESVRVSILLKKSKPDKAKQPKAEDK
jgi:hypothetical protein